MNIQLFNCVISFYLAGPVDFHAFLLNNAEYRRI